MRQVVGCESFTRVKLSVAALRLEYHNNMLGLDLRLMMTGLFDYS